MRNTTLIASLAMAVSLLPGMALSYLKPTLSTATPPTASQVFKPAWVDDDTVIFLADFETTGGMNAWTSSDLTNPGPTWHRDVYNAYNNHSWWVGKQTLAGYDNNWLQYLVTDTFSISGVTNPRLTCKVYWATEPPLGPFPTGYDGWDGCNVWIWNGFIWQLLIPDFPAYNTASQYGFGWLWGMGLGIPAWAGTSDWVTAQFDLSSYTFLPNVRLRIAFCSDPANCTAENTTWTGIFVDDILVTDGSTIYLSDDAEGNPYPGESTFATGDPYGNYWVLTTPQAHSPTHSWNCDDRFFLSDALISPTVNIPAGMSTILSYWVYCDMPDFDGDHDDFLDDYYYIEVLPTSSSTWIPIAYDYARNGSQLQWVERIDGVWNSLPVPILNLTPWAGQSVKLRFRTVTDGDNNGGIGNGLYIDDVTLISHILPNNDVGAYKLVIPFPTYQGQSQVAGSVELINYGVLNQPQVPASWSVNGLTTPFIPWASINAGDTLIRNFAWTPPASGSFDFKAFTHMSGDQNQTNDSSHAGVVEVTPTGFFELGYDHRQLSYLPETDLLAFNFGQGGGAMVHFTPETDGLAGTLYGSTLKVMFRTAGDFTLHFFENGEFGQPGNEVHSRPITLSETQIFPNWANIDISDVAFLQGGHPDFWVWLEVTAQNFTPHITGYLEDAFSYGHFFFHDNQGTEQTIINFNIRAIMTGTAAVDPNLGLQPASIMLLAGYPNPFNSMVHVSFTLPAPVDVQLEILDLMGRRVATLVNGRVPVGEQAAIWDAGDFPSGNYWIRLIAGSRIMTERIVLLK